MTGNSPPLLNRANNKPPHWAGEGILAWDDAAFHRLEPFITASYWSDQESINIHRVVGTQHPDYQGKTWLEFLNGGKRMDINLPLHHSNPGYYLDTEPKSPSMHYVSLDGLNYYVSVDGNHRTCIAKFDFHYTGRVMLHGITLVRHQVDWAFYQYYQGLVGYARAHQLPLLFSPKSTTVSRDDTGEWKLDRFSPGLKVENYQDHTTETLDREAALVLLTRLRTQMQERHRLRWFPWPQRQ
jgi:hypothetical protein